MRTTLARLKEKKGDEGFTLIELLIVIIILAILATIVIFAVGTTTKNAAVASCKSTVKEIQTAVQAYRAQKGAFPGTLTELASHTTTTTIGPWLKTKPPTSTTLNKNYWFNTTIAATGVVTVYTTGHTAGANTTPTPCATA